MIASRKARRLAISAAACIAVVAPLGGCGLEIVSTEAVDG